MKLVRYGRHGHERPGLIDATGRLRDLSPLVGDFGGETLSRPALDRLRRLDPEQLRPVEGAPRLGCCLADAPNLFCVGLNSTTQAADAGLEPPADPILGSKATSALAGPEDPLTLPPHADTVDVEVELAVVIGVRARRVPEDRALDYVAGYALLADIADRRLQAAPGGQWLLGKSAPGFAPLGPWLATSDEIENPQALELWLELGGERLQEASTADMIASAAEIVAYASRAMDLRVGDVIGCGGPAGAGLWRDPPRFLRPGDVIACGGSGLGRMRIDVRASDP